MQGERGQAMTSAAERDASAAGHGGQLEVLQGEAPQRHRAAPRQSLTPELVADDHLAGHSMEGAPVLASRKLFSIFRPASERKVCCCVWSPLYCLNPYLAPRGLTTKAHKWPLPFSFEKCPLHHAERGVEVG